MVFQFIYFISYLLLVLLSHVLCHQNVYFFTYYCNQYISQNLYQPLYIHDKNLYINSIIQIKHNTIIIQYNRISTLTIKLSHFTMYPRLKPSQDQFDHLKQTKYCIQSSKKAMQSKKQETFRNKLCFDYSLQKINKQKIYGNVMNFANSVYPKTQSKGFRYHNFMYSSDKVKATRNRFLSYRYKEQDQTYHMKEQNKKIKHFIAQRKNQQGGIDSFWLFKKDPVKQQKKKPKGQINGEKAQQQQANQQAQQNKIEQAYLKILTFAKMPLEFENSIIPRNTFSKYISSIYGETFCLWFINFYQFKNYMNFKQFESICDKFQGISLRESHLLSFFLYDDNGDGLLCPRDLFSVFQRQLSSKIDTDILQMGQYVKENQGKKLQNQQKFKIQNICIRDQWLTIKDYEIYFKKVDEPYLKATNKKDTVFSKSFAVLDHRQKIRSKRKQINQKRNLYEQLYGEIAKTNKDQAYIDSQSDYKLNYSAMYNIFGSKPTQLFIYFMLNIFGLSFGKFSGQL